jgi:antitoxin component of RelBE/YafQ-DinJ toxin-antitoxin module
MSKNHIVYLRLDDEEAARMRRIAAKLGLTAQQTLRALIAASSDDIRVEGATVAGLRTR